MNPIDYAVLGFYFVYLLAISWVCRKFVHNVSDYFRSGGQVVWWMAGGSVFMLSISAWTFTGAASRAYGDGWPIMLIYLANIVGFLMNALYFGPRFRQLRVVTAMQAVRARFGARNEQFFTWLTLLVRTIYAGIWLCSLGVFFSAAFGEDVMPTILLAGGTVMVVSLLSGSWAVVASDFIQVLILMPVTLVTMVFTVARLGGPVELVHKLSATRLDFHKLFSDDFLLLWGVAILFKQFVSTNNLTEAPRYICVKDSRHARWAALLAAALMLMGSIVWFLPPMAASLIHPNIAGVYPKLLHPEEGAYFAMATSILPVGMVGLLVTGIFAATMSAMDAGLNSNSGFFVKNFYQVVLRPKATDREMLFAGKITTLVLGLLVILLAVFLSQRPILSLFELYLNFSILVTLPQAMPLVLGLFIRRTPAWSGWSTWLVGFCTGYETRQHFTLAWAMQTFSPLHLNPNRWEAQNWSQAIAAIMIMGVCTAWFCFTRFFYNRESASYKAAVEEFSRNIETPVNYDKEEASAATDNKQSRLIGWLCMPYGALVCLLSLVPNPLPGRLAFIFCGGIVVLVGTALVRHSKKIPPGRTAITPLPVSILAAITPAEREDFLPGPLFTEARGIAADFRLIDPEKISPADFYRELAAANPEILVGCWKTPLLPAVLPPRLRYLCYLAGSPKKLITRAHIERGLLVTNWGNSISRVVAECALLHILSCLRRTCFWITTIHHEGGWKNGDPQISSLFGRRIGLHGFGSVARELVLLLRPFCVTISSFAPDITAATEKEFGITRAHSLDSLFADNEIIVELAPLIPATVRCVTERHLRLIRPGGVFVNVGRGQIVDEEALVRVAREGNIFIGLDVFSVEP
ncbi:MAG TPA: NAD(P)-dependent oxidoreductase, partial [Opitutaceae bacterium]|nr:NAD(P)-dependent oxidoreductase [Opitutaceae bacterium]